MKQVLILSVLAQDQRLFKSQQPRSHQSRRDQGSVAFQAAAINELIVPIIYVFDKIKTIQSQYTVPRLLVGDAQVGRTGGVAIPHRGRLVALPSLLPN